LERQFIAAFRRQRLLARKALHWCLIEKAASRQIQSGNKLPHSKFAT
jgi:hypothetical protein